MFYLISFIVIVAYANVANGEICDTKCPDEKNVICGFDAKGLEYKIFAGKCALTAYSECHKIVFTEEDMKYCIKNHKKQSRRMIEEESCPKFCAEYYRPVCGASKLKNYVYRAFNNICYLDMLNCRSADEFNGYVEVPLHKCQRHDMKNIFHENVVLTNYNDHHYRHRLAPE